jgi:hypothetical protein
MTKLWDCLRQGILQLNFFGGNISYEYLAS